MTQGTRSAVVAALGIALLAAAPARARDRAAEREIARIEDVVMKARSGSELLPFLTPDTVMYDIMPPAYFGPAAVRRHIDEVVSSPAWKHFVVTLVRSDIRADKEFGYANSVQHLRWTDENGKILLDTDFRITNSYERIAGRWLIAYQHLSFPVDMATGKVVFGRIESK